MQAMIETVGLKKTYRMGAVEVRALQGVSIAIEKGEFVGIMGPSGSGKSTLLHMLGLLDRQTSGDINVDGVDISKLTDHERTHFRLNRLGYVFQDYALVTELTALENVYLPCLVRMGASRECMTRCEHLLTRVGLGERMHHLNSELSGGEQQRVAIARSLANNPEIILADEPCANLDSENSKTVLDLFRSLNEELSQTIVMVTHEEWHKSYFDRIIYLRDGLLDRHEYPRRNPG
jgi:putative ABC transport system ATP-binding protein